MNTNTVTGSVFNTTAQLTERRSVWDTPKQPPAKKNPDRVASHGSCRTALRAVRFLLGSNPTGLPSVRRARVMCPREQSLKPFHKWDSVGCLALLNAKQSDPQCRCGLFAVTKMQRRIL